MLAFLEVPEFSCVTLPGVIELQQNFSDPMEKEAEIYQLSSSRCYSNSQYLCAPHCFKQSA